MEQRENGAFHLLEGPEEVQAPGGGAVILAWGIVPFQDTGSPSPPVNSVSAQRGPVCLLIRGCAVSLTGQVSGCWCWGDSTPSPIMMGAMSNQSEGRVDEPGGGLSPRLRLGWGSLGLSLPRHACRNLPATLPHSSLYFLVRGQPSVYMYAYLC